MIEADCIALVEANHRNDGNETTVGEFAPFSYGKALKKNKRNSAGSVPVYGSNGIVGWHDEAVTQGPTVVVGRKGTVGAVHYSPVPCWPIDTTFFVTGQDPELVRFQYYALKSLKLDRMNSDSAVPGLNREAAHARSIRIPPSTEQRSVANVLGTLDDKIELNRRMNETLEAIAQALFKSWFVDFDPVRAKVEGRWRPGESLPSLPAHLYDLFPDRLIPSKLGEIPEGWDVKPLTDCFTLTMGQSPPGDTYNDERIGLPFFQGSTDFNLRYPKVTKYCSEPQRTAQLGDTLVSVRAPVGAVNMAWEECCIGRGLASLKHKSNAYSFTYYSILNIKSQLQQFKHTGTVFGAITKQQLGNMQCIMPTFQVIQAFGFYATDLDNFIYRTTAESAVLSSYVNTILLSLMTGNIR